MRFKSVMLLLFLTGALFGQSNCQIADLTATFVAANPANPCQYFISLNFQHSATTNQYTVTGNGNNYGTFSYSQDPVTLGPFTAGNTATLREFVVRDAVFQDCQDQVTIEIPACSAAACEIYDLTAQPGDCNSNTGTYNLTLNFQVANPTNSKFDLWAGTGAFLGSYGLNELPLHVSNFPWGGGTTDELKVCINDNQNCCRSIAFDAPTCFFNDPCNISDLEVFADSCTSDTTYRLKFNFVVNGIALADSFALYGNGQFVGNYALAQLPLTIPNFHWDGGAVDYIKVCLLTPPNGQPCCLTTDYHVPDCLNPCGINGLLVNVDSCTTDSTFRITLNFNVNDPTAVDSFDLWGNSHYLGHFGMNQLPLSLDSFLWNGLVINQIRVCAGNTPACCKELAFLAPNCLPFGPCEITNVFAVTGACTGDSTYKVRIFFNATNPGNGTYTAYTNSGASLGTYPLTHIPLQIDSFPWSGNMMDIIKICINPDTPDTAACCRTWEFPVPACLHNNPPCEIYDLTAVPGDCIPGSNTYSLVINFQVQNPGNQFFEVRANNGVLIGTYPLSQLPLTIPNFPASGNQFDLVRVCINDHPDCCRAIEFHSPCVQAPCSISGLVVETGDCTGDSTYHVVINFQATNPLSNTFTVWANGNLFGTYNLNQLPLAINNFPWNGGVNDVVKVCFMNQAGAPDCCATKEFPVPACLNPGPCEIYDLTAVPGDCIPGSNTYSLVINFQVQNPGNQFFEVRANNGVFIGTYPLSQLPLTIPNFPASGNQFDLVRVCINDHPDCCRAIEFHSPCVQAPCSISGLVVETGDCTGDSTYHVVINFQATNPLSNTFTVWANGNLFGTYNLNQLPLAINNFPWNGGANDVVKVCFMNQAGAPDCCATKEFPVPACLNPGPCEIFNLTAVPGDCIPGSNTYSLVINFQVQNPGNQFFEVRANNGVLIGTYPLSQLPLTIPNFPASGNQFDLVRVCINDHPDCCRAIEFHSPCVQAPCSISGLVVETGDCTSDSTYHVVINFQATNPLSNTFTVWANGNLFGTYNLNQLPLAINNFPWNGGVNDVVKVCFMNSAGVPDCCASKEFPVPACLNPGPCEIYNLTAVPGDCIPGSNTYSLVINFQVQNPGNQFFEVRANNGVLIGTYPLSQLPLTIPNFPASGNQFDLVKVCINDHPDCCRAIEFLSPCTSTGNCSIHNLEVLTGDCTGDSTYQLKVNFAVTNPPSNNFTVWANGVQFGNYNLSQLPLMITNFPWNGGVNDVIKICFETPPGTVTCCETREFPVPDCLGQSGPCAISNLVVETGACTSDSSYKLVLNFTVTNPPSNTFGVWANNEFLGLYNINQLPLSIPNFPWNGGANDVVKVCFGNGGVATCCAVREFPVPDCLTQTGTCEIHNLNVTTGDCTSNTTYQLGLNFSVTNPPSNVFEVWANGVLFGTYNLGQLPLSIPNFPSDGGVNDVVKVCMVPNTPNVPACCAVKEFPVPDCIGNNPCEIWDLHVVHTPCLCGQFFALLSFNSQNVGTGGFDVTVNGNPAGNFPYNTPQPIILGPFNGDGTTVYHFAVTDHQHADCHDEFEMGKVECMSPVVTPVNDAKLVLSPNPAADWISVSVQMSGAAKAGQTKVDIFHADGRLVQTQIIGDGSNFQLDISGLPAGMYRIVLQTEAGRLEGTFAKQ